jgi:hypothetical protein
MSKQPPFDNFEQQTERGSHAQTRKPWEGNPEPEQRSATKRSGPDKWKETDTH